MQCDNIDLVGRFCEMIGYSMRNERVRDAMETVLAQLILLGYLRVDRVGVDVSRHA